MPKYVDQLVDALRQFLIVRINLFSDEDLLFVHVFLLQNIKINYFFVRHRLGLTVADVFKPWQFLLNLVQAA